MKPITRRELIEKYINFFKSKGHKEIPSASLIPENDPTVLFTTAGMQPLVPYLLGQKHPLGKRIVNVQKCIRTGDIEEIGDEVHHTFFEMLGNWSLGDYWKKEAIAYTFEFHAKVLGIPREKYAVSVFAGDRDAPRDEESVKVWLSLGIPKERIAFLPKENNWWGPAGEIGPCGPDTEMFYWIGKKSAPKKFDAEDKNWVEIGNDVFIEYNKDKRLILVDGMHCLYDENFNLNRELLDIINLLNTHTILIVNKFKEKGHNLALTDANYSSNWKAFSLEDKDITKSNPEYFKALLKKFNLAPEEVMYFDHDKKNIETASKLGILSKHYTDNKSIKKFIEENLWAFIPLEQKNVDFGGGVERTLAILNGFDDNYLTDSFLPIIKKIEQLSGKKYERNKKEMRVIADHIKAAVFIIGDGVQPSNTGRGYVLRRLIRRSVRYGKMLEINNFCDKIAEVVINEYKDYSELDSRKKFIFEELKKEEEKFNLTLEKGLKKFNEIAKDKKITGEEGFLLFQSYGFPIEITKELAKEMRVEYDPAASYALVAKHQELSRTASSGMFKSGLADNSEMTVRLHTATHLLNEALRYVLGADVRQRGSNITPERLRFDFNFSRKLTDEELKRVEDLVNEKIKKGLDVVREEMVLEKAFSSGAQGEFGAKYPSKVSVYTVSDKSEKKGWFSKEICTGPHVKNTREVGKFKILKEESVSAGVRRIKATVE